jgi:hypothetical protein
MARRWNVQANILGFGIGPKQTLEKEAAPEDALIVFVADKVAETRLHRHERIPARVRLESIGRWVTTDVQALGEIPKLQAAPVLMPGSDAAHFTMAHGTITAIVKPRVPPFVPLLLSCAHGFTPLGAAGNVVESPPDPSALMATNAVANVTFARPLTPGGAVANVVDAALARPMADRIGGLSNIIPGLGRLVAISSLLSGQFRANGIVTIGGTGASTPRLTGTIFAENVSALLADSRGRVYMYQNVVANAPTPLPQAGDSGMPIVRFITPGQLELLGMHVGFGGLLGAPNAKGAFFIPANVFMGQLAVDLA